MQVKIIVHNTYSQIFGNLDSKVINKIHNKLSYELPGAYFISQYNPYGSMKYLFSKRTYASPTGLIHFVREILEKENVAYTIIDSREQPSPSNPLILHGDPLRDYQQYALNEAVKKQRGILKIATGGGKTNIIAALTAALNVPTLILIHKKDVFYQIIERLEGMIQQPIGRVGDGLCQTEKFTVGMIQTISRLYEPATKKKKRRKKEEKVDDEIIQTKGDIIRQLVETSECVITDECHHVPSDSFWDIHKKTKKAYYKFGFSASPWREDGADLLIEAAHARKIVDISASELIEKGYLAPPKVYLHEFKHVKKNRDDYTYNDIYDEDIVNNVERNKIIVEIALKAAQEGKTTLIAITKIEHGRLLEAFLQQVEPNALFVSGESDSEVRKQVLKDLNERKRKIVICTTIFGEGVDVPNLDVLINAKASKSSVDAFQLIGRVLRKTKTKSKAFLVDIFDKSCKYITSHSNKRLKIYKTEPRYELHEVSFPDQINFKE